jgi:sugar-specific transcriptional regulator TrmB
MKSSQLVEQLVGIGFTEYEAKVYLALLREHPATGYLLSKQSGVPRSMVYEALGRLSARGAVLSTTDEKSTLYRPLPPEALLEGLRREHHQLMHALSSGLDDLFDSKPEDLLWTIGAETAVLAYASKMIDSAHEELMLVLPDFSLASMEKKICEASDRGVDTYALLTGDGELGCGRVARHPPRESELHELTESTMVVVDRREVLIASGFDEVTATITNNHNLVHIARQFIWMELFAQRIFAQLGVEMLERLSKEDRAVFEGFSPVMNIQEET